MQEHVCILSPSLICWQGILKVDISKVLLYSHNQLLICNTKKRTNQPKTKNYQKTTHKPPQQRAFKVLFFSNIKVFLY